MCIIEVKTYFHNNGRKETVESIRRCHNAVGDGVCEYVRKQNVDARVVETRPSSRAGSLSDDVVIVGADGKERRYHRLTRSNSHKPRDSKRSTQSPVDSVASLTSLSGRSYRTNEIRPPSAMSSPTLPTVLPSARYQGPSGGFSPITRPDDPYRIITPDGVAPDNRPPALSGQDVNAQRNPFSARRMSSNRGSGDSAQRPPLRRPRVSFGVGTGPSGASSSEGSSSFVPRSPPNVDHLRNDSTSNLPFPRSNSALIDEEVARQLQAEERQAAVERQRLSDSARTRPDPVALAEAEARRRRLDEIDRRERDRRTRQAEDDARRRADEHQRSREASRERTERKRREAQDALEGKREAEQRAKKIDNLVDAELAQMAAEREASAARQRESIERYQQSRSSPTTTRTTYRYTGGSSSPVSTRSPTGSTRYHSAVVHNYPSSRRNSILLERGDAVIERERRRTAAEEMNDAMAEMSMNMAYEEETILDTDARFEASQRARRERRELEARERRRLEDQRRRDAGYF